MTAYRYWFIDATDAGFESSESMIVPAGKKLADLQVVKGISGKPSNQIAIDWNGSDAPKRERTPTDTTARDATDLRVLEFLQSPMSQPSVGREKIAEAVLGGVSEEAKQTITGALNRLKSAGTVKSLGRNQWTAVKAKEASGT